MWKSTLKSILQCHGIDEQVISQIEYKLTKNIRNKRRLDLVQNLNGLQTIPHEPLLLYDFIDKLCNGRHGIFLKEKITPQIKDLHAKGIPVTYISSGKASCNNDYIDFFKCHGSTAKKYIYEICNELEIFDIEPEHSLQKKEIMSMFKHGDFLCIDYETDTITRLGNNMRPILFSIYDSRNGKLETFDDMPEHLPKLLNNRLLIAHKLKFDFSFLKYQLHAKGWFLYSHQTIFASKMKDILSTVIFWNIKTGEQIEIAIYDTLTICPSSLATIAKIVKQALPKLRQVNDMLTQDLINEFEKQTSKGIVIENIDTTNHIEALNFIDSLYNNKPYNGKFANLLPKNIDSKLDLKMYFNELMDDENIKITDSTIHAFNDTAVKFAIMRDHMEDYLLSCLDGCNEEQKETFGNARQRCRMVLRNSKLYHDYNRKDIVILSLFFKHFEVIFSEALKEPVTRKLTISSLAYSMFQDITTKAIIDKLSANHSYLETLNFFEVTRERFFQYLKFTKCDEHKGILHTNCRIYYEYEGHYFVICYPKILLEKFNNSYRGGVVYYKEKITKTTTEQQPCGYKLDVNSSYPFAMSIVKFNPYSKVFSSNEIDKVNAILAQQVYNPKPHQKFMCDNLVSRIKESMIYKKAPINMKELFINMGLGKCSIVVSSFCRSIDKINYGLMIKSEKEMKNYNVFGTINKPLTVNLLDLVNCNADVDLTEMFITINDINEVGEKIYQLFEIRNQLKTEKNGFQEIYKLVMNSAYGKFGSTISESTIKRTKNNGETISQFLVQSIPNRNARAILKKYLHGKKIYTLNQLKDLGRVKFDHLQTKCELIPHTNGIELILQKGMTVTSYILNLNTEYSIVHMHKYAKYQQSNYNLFVAGAITAMARSTLTTYKILLENNGCEVLYSDTDSLLTFGLDLNEPWLNTELGALKIEEKITSLTIAGKKMYCTTNIKNELTIKFKGVHENDYIGNPVDELVNGSSPTFFCAQFGRQFTSEPFVVVTKNIIPNDKNGLVEYSSIC